VTIDEGVIRYESDWTPGPGVEPRVAALLERWRHRLFDAGLIGHDERHDVGYGNLSVRYGDGFVISGTQTGHVATTTGEHYAEVTGYDIDRNRVTCSGPVQASSESMTHAALYDVAATINAVVHVHSATLWSRCRDVLPTTDPGIGYGTPAMAHEFGRLYRETAFATHGVAVMGGHADGIIAIGGTLEQASRRILDLSAGRAAVSPVAAGDRRSR